VIEQGVSEQAAESDESTLTRTRLVLGALTAGLLILTALSGLIRLPARTAVLVGPASLLGIVSPVIGLRLYVWIRSRIPRAAGRSARLAAFYKANVTALGVTDAIGTLGLLGFLLSGQIVCLFGVLSHVLLAGALWPTQERMDRFLKAGSGEGGAES